MDVWLYLMVGRLEVCSLGPDLRPLISEKLGKLLMEAITHCWYIFNATWHSAGHK